MTAPPARLPTLGYLLLIGITIFWGTNWPALKIVLSELPVLWFRTWCLGFSGIGLLSIALASGSSIRVPRKERWPLIYCAAFATIGWHVFSAYGVTLMPAGRAVIIAFSMPAWAAVLGHYILGEPLTKAKIAGVVLGIAGLAVLIGPDLVVFRTAPLGALVMLAASVSWGIGTILIKRTAWTIPTTTLVGWQLVASTVPLLIGALALEPLPNLEGVSATAWGTLAYISLFPLLFGQWAYIKTVRLFPASIAAIGTMAVPVVGVFSSALLLDEQVGLREIGALSLVCAALFVVLVLPAIRQASSRP